jgi:hypothetical protein
MRPLRTLLLSFHYFFTFRLGNHDKRLQEPAVTNLYEHLMNPLFEIYGFVYLII